MEPAAVPPRAGRDRWTVKELLGGGSMGRVYRAFDAEFGKDVALKTLPVRDPEQLYHFKREFRRLSDLRHPNLVTLHDLVVDGEESFFTMELVDGTDLRGWVRGDAPVPGPPPAGGWSRLRAALRQLLDGLETLHATGRLHRDLKPSNILVTRDGRVVLVDFGLASIRSLTLSGSSDQEELVGTFVYMAPELSEGRPASVASDVYALGVTVFEALTGRLPFADAPDALVEAKAPAAAAGAA